MTQTAIWSSLLFAILAPGAGSPFAGTWQGYINDLPAIELSINKLGGKTGGEIVFYFQQRGANGKWQVKGGTPQPLLNIQSTAKTLSFEVTHHKFHGSRELGPNVKFRVDYVSDQELRLFKTAKDPSPRDSGFKLTRAKKAGK
jgi:hypothetical protein